MPPPGEPSRAKHVLDLHGRNHVRAEALLVQRDDCVSGEHAVLTQPVAEAHRGKGIGKALLLACLQEMKLKGYGYAIIGWVSSEEFYEKSAAAIAIPDSTPGIWKDWLGNTE